MIFGFPQAQVITTQKDNELSGSAFELNKSKLDSPTTGVGNSPPHLRWFQTKIYKAASDTGSPKHPLPLALGDRFQHRALAARLASLQMAVGTPSWDRAVRRQNGEK